MSFPRSPPPRVVPKCRARSKPSALLGMYPQLPKIHLVQLWEDSEENCQLGGGDQIGSTCPLHGLSPCPPAEKRAKKKKRLKLRNCGASLTVVIIVRKCAAYIYAPL